MATSRRISGGLHDFYDDGEVEPLEPHRVEAIREGYKEYDARKNKTRNTIIILIVVGMALIGASRLFGLI